MPAIMLCMAMARVRRAIATASATRSSRSTRMTTSAAFEEALAPRAAHGDADIRCCEGRRVIDTVADHQGRREPSLVDNRVDLVRGNAVGEHGVEIEGRRRRFGGIGRSPVTMTIWRRRPGEGSNRARRLATQFVGDRSTAIIRSSTATKTVRADRQEARAPRVAHSRAALAVNEVEGADAELGSLDDAFHSRSQHSRTSRGPASERPLARPRRRSPRPRR